MNGKIMQLGIMDRFKMNGKTWTVIDIVGDQYICICKAGGAKVTLTKKQIESYIDG